MIQPHHFKLAKSSYYRDNCIPVFIATLFTTAKLGA
jgi:hypothetical protein